MTRKIAGIASLATVVATLGLATTGISGSASADPTGDELTAVDAQPQVKPDNRPDPLSRKQTAQRRDAVDALVTGKARTVGKGPDRTIKMPNGANVEYPASQSAQLLTFLIEFGNGSPNPAFPDNTAGPLHNEIPEPARSDNTHLLAARLQQAALPGHVLQRPPRAGWRVVQERLQGDVQRQVRPAGRRLGLGKGPGRRVPLLRRQR